MCLPASGPAAAPRQRPAEPSSASLRLAAGGLSGSTRGRRDGRGRRVLGRAARRPRATCGTRGPTGAGRTPTTATASPSSASSRPPSVAPGRRSGVRSRAGRGLPIATTSRPGASSPTHGPSVSAAPQQPRGGRGPACATGRRCDVSTRGRANRGGAGRGRPPAGTAASSSLSPTPTERGPTRSRAAGDGRA